MRVTFAGKTGLFLVGGLLSLSLAGCGIGTQMAAPAETAAVKLQGNVMGGQQGVAGSTIGLYAVGTSGYGSAATSLLNTTVTTDKFGSFSITYDYNGRHLGHGDRRRQHFDYCYGVVLDLHHRRHPGLLHQLGEQHQHGLRHPPRGHAAHGQDRNQHIGSGRLHEPEPDQH